MFFNLAFLFDFIIDYILVLYFSVAFLFLLFLVVLVWGVVGFAFRFLEPI
ncbi:putative membrane protein [Helicobacter pylori NQ4200]|uniref:Putative membrane protein n=1 Tax=Helicobacter pylori NQ4200 TaxID=992024 RepID=I9Q398_HELPX|nr:putative membrane protein [Helicobacter pylori NQ4200]